MDGLVCDACGEPLLLRADLRYILRIEGFAAYDPLELTQEDMKRDFETEWKALMDVLSRLDAREAEDSVHRAFSFDLCPPCWRRYLADPLAGLRDRPLRLDSTGEGPEESSPP
jgi:hypothetical protein